ncbi:MAG: Asp-tRNA(Asn)/Glu-tRNA(Gln) amidotransferase GatCAB subunit A [Deltaproteobacteria bacterium]|jgi:aspartyl-tRNA(Asn)/glutamyl-tRNA(Gln) amidotransferase subunit A|nr:Asp-tRNA(Asn)/Glu-tRNA(Gln) amidotransferase GatCAB subunit A [Deltaproteobacteria bacterium]
MGTAESLLAGSLSRQREGLDRGEVSATELVEASLARIDAHAGLNAVVSRRDEAARVEAEASAERIAQGKPLSDLDGIPILLKGNIVQAGELATCSSRILENFVSPYDAGATERLVAAGAVIVGRANMDEFAMGSSTEHSIFGPSHNPWDETRTGGGSSGGSAAAVAAGLVPLALGSDTGGSIRQPASFCGVVGLKPTYGRVSRWGLVAFASSLDQIGPIGRRASDCAALLETIAGHDPRDSTSLPEPMPRLRDALDGDVSGLVVGLPREYFVEEGVDPGVLARVREAIAVLEEAGIRFVDVSLPHTAYTIATYYLIATAEASSNLARFDGVRYGRRADRIEDLTDLYERSRSEGFGAEVKRRILLGTYVLSAGYYDAYYGKAQRVRTLIRRDFEQAFLGCDLILTPTTPETAFRLGAKSDDPVSMYLSDVYTVSANLAGLPGLSMPCGLSEGMPVGLQLLGKPLDEKTILRVADAFERLTDHHGLMPPGRV